MPLILYGNIILIRPQIKNNHVQYNSHVGNNITTKINAMIFLIKLIMLATLNNIEIIFNYLLYIFSIHNIKYSYDDLLNLSPTSHQFRLFFTYHYREARWYGPR